MTLEPKDFLSESDPSKFEEAILEFWEEKKVFEKSLENTQKNKPFTFYDGPPFATGLPHYGHILGSTIKDLVGRYQTMRGRYVRRRWGWDCHGLPIEEIVERQLNISGKKQIEEIGIKKFNETCRSMVLRFADEWKKTVRRIARWVEFDNSYKTMDRSFMESVWWGFKQIYDKGLVYEGRKVLLYCPRCETPVSNFEIAMDNSYKEVMDTAVTVKFKLKTISSKLKAQIGENAYLLAWTTTPWTLPGNAALAVGKDIDYSLVEVKKEEIIERYLLATDAINAVFDRELVTKDLVIGHLISGSPKPGSSQTEYKLLDRYFGKDLVGLAYKPLFDVPEIQANEKSYKVYAADFVKIDEGTGIVHTAVVYGEDDYALGLREGLAVVPLLDEKGKFNDKAPEFLRAQYFKDADALVVADLEARGLLFRKEDYTHSYPHCWRCGTPLFYNAIPSWFINIQKIKPGLLESNAKEMNWFPAHLKHGRYEKSVEQAPDWNISRNRYWGNPIPVWRCEGEESQISNLKSQKNCNNTLVVGNIRELKERSAARNTYLFLRHGESDNVVDGITGPHVDTPEYTAHLTLRGKEEVERTAREIKKHNNINLIISSPLARTRETADIVARVTGAKVITQDDLRDIDAGMFRWKKVSLAQEYRKEMGLGRLDALPDGEGANAVRKRMVGAFRGVDASHTGKTILIVSHADPLWILKGALEGLDDEKILEAPYPKVGELYPIDARPIPLNDEGEVDLHRPYIDDIILSCEKCGGEMRRTKEIFDSWVEAGSMPFAELHYPFEHEKLFHERFPAQFVAEYIAQTRAWFYVMHVISYIIFGKAPVENLVTTGTVLTEDGSKMSKSKGNYPDPWLVLGKYGADALRFSLMNSVVMQAENVNFSEREVGNAYRKIILIWKNVVNYYQTYVSDDLQPTTYPASTSRGEAGNLQPIHILDKWIVARTEELVRGVTEGFDGYDTVRSTRTMADYIDDLSTWYVRRSRRRTEKEFFETLRHVLLVSARVMAPVMPYMAEAVFQLLTRRPETLSVHFLEWPFRQSKDKPEADEEKLLADMRAVREIASAGQALRKEKNIPLRQPIASLKMKSDARQVTSDKELLEILKQEINVKTIVVDPGIAEEFELDTELTPELRREGLVRGLERAIQGLRKEKGFKVGEQARLIYNTEDEDILAALKEFNKEKTYITEVAPGSPAGEPIELDGKKIWLGVTRE